MWRKQLVGTFKIDLRDDMMCVYAQKGAPCYIPELWDTFPSSEVMTAEGEESEKMGVTGPWATDCVDQGPLAGLTGTRPVVDQYSITRYSEGEWRKHNADVLGGAHKETHLAKVYVYLQAYAIN
jgi:hypothetical protein